MANIWQWILMRRDPFMRERRKTKPPVNYNPQGFWRDYFDTLPDDIFTRKQSVEDRDLYDRREKP